MKALACIALGAVALSAALALGAVACEVTGCDVNNTAYYKFGNESDADLEVFVDGDSVGTAEPGDFVEENIKAGVTHVVEFKFEDGTVACLSEVAPVQCETYGLDCDTPSP